MDKQIVNRRNRVRVELDYSTLIDAILALQELQAEYGSLARLDFQAEPFCGVVSHVLWNSEETDEEYSDRLAREKAAETKQDLERTEYERLKAKFGNK